ncbi:hypothetical protein STRDD13_00762 [Streptococcus sp. DD13]|nr:hypothetical protein STRDD13_00762 [Streptococcus sp. DD13]
MYLQLKKADLFLKMAEEQGIKAHIEGGASQISYNFRKIRLPYRFEKEGKAPVRLQIRTLESRIRIKEVRDAKII